jgi:hypothetical protein
MRANDLSPTGAGTHKRCTKSLESSRELVDRSQDMICGALAINRRAEGASAEVCLNLVPPEEVSLLG